MLTLVNPGDANCLLEGLRDGLEGRYHWSVDGGNGGQFGSSTFIDLRPNRVALVTHVSNFDLSQSRSYNGPTSLQDAGYFTQCLTQTEPANILDCLDAATLACGG
jgi:hypothetical protein